MSSTDVAVGYTLATGRLFCPVDDFIRFASGVLGRPVELHELTHSALWDELRARWVSSLDLPADSGCGCA